MLVLFNASDWLKIGMSLVLETMRWHSYTFHVLFRTIVSAACRRWDFVYCLNDCHGDAFARTPKFPFRESQLKTFSSRKRSDKPTEFLLFGRRAFDAKITAARPARGCTYPRNFIHVRRMGSCFRFARMRFGGIEVFRFTAVNFLLILAVFLPVFSPGADFAVRFRTFGRSE